MNVTIESAHFDCERIQLRIGFGQRCVESIAECDQRQSSVCKCNTKTLKLDSCKVCTIDYYHGQESNLQPSMSYDNYSHHLWPNPCLTSL